MAISIQHFFHEPSYTYSYVVSDRESGHCAVIDPVLDFDAASGATGTEAFTEIISYIRTNRLDLRWILETHAHADHLSSAKAIQNQIGGKVAIGEKVGEVQTAFKKIFNLGDEFVADGRQFDRLIADGETVALGASRIMALATPGHTPACLSYLIEDALFCGDTLFMPDYGTARCDFPGGDAGTLYDSIQTLLKQPPETRIFLCHDYAPNGRDYQFLTTVADQRENNIHIGGGISKEAFVAMRTQRDAGLNMPALILPSLQINIRAGALPPVEDNGTAYLKLPLNLF